MPYLFWLQFFLQCLSISFHNTTYVLLRSLFQTMHQGNRRRSYRPIQHGGNTTINHLRLLIFPPDLKIYLQSYSLICVIKTYVFSFANNKMHLPESYGLVYKLNIKYSLLKYVTAHRVTCLERSQEVLQKGSYAQTTVEWTWSSWESTFACPMHWWIWRSCRCAFESPMKSPK